MGILKFTAKAVGTAALLATGTASAVLKTAADIVGMDFGSDLFDAAKNSSFEGIRSIWGDGMSETGDKLLNHYERGSDVISQAASEGTRQKLSQTARDAAEMAKEHGDMEKYEQFMEQSERF